MSKTSIASNSRFLISLATVLLLSALTVGCSVNNGGATYLPYNMKDASEFGGITSDSSPIEDNHSHWEGDGVRGQPKIVIDISDQRAYFYKDTQLVGISKISSGRDGFNTPTGQYKITQKSRDHRSNLYGEYVRADGTVVQKDVDVTKDPQPPGTKFLGAAMPYFMRFHGGVGLHAGYLPGWADSHGCVRMPEYMAEIYFKNVSLKTPVIVQE